MEGKYTGIRPVHASADIKIKKCVEKKETQSIVQDIDKKTGKEEKKIEIKLHKFKINFHKGLSKFQKYDTIITTKKIKLFSNFYLPIEVLKITNLETVKEHKEYTVPELTEKIKADLEVQLNEELGIENSENIEKNLEVETIGNDVSVKLIYTLYEDIGTKEVLK